MRGGWRAVWAVIVREQWHADLIGIRWGWFGDGGEEEEVDCGCVSCRLSWCGGLEALHQVASFVDCRDAESGGPRTGVEGLGGLGADYVVR